MNKRHLLVLLVLLCAVCCVFGLSACGDPGGNGGGSSEIGGGSSKEHIEVNVDYGILTVSSTVEDIRRAATVYYFDKNGNSTCVTDYEISGSIEGAGMNVLTFRYNGLNTNVQIFIKEPTYTLTFMHQGQFYYTFEDWQPSQGKPDFNTPDSEDPWYEWVWEDYTFGNATDITINSQLVLKEFTITFTGYDNQVITRKFTKETVSIDEPEVPAAPGYSGKWYEYELEPFDFGVNAKYTANKYTVSFDFNGATSGNTAEPFEITFSYALPSLPTPEREDKAFDGWYVGDTEITSRSIWNIPNDATLVARWRELKNCTITFDSNSGSRVEDVTAKENSLLTEPAEPARNDYLFAGWYRDEELKNEWNFASGKVNDDMTLYAKWVYTSTGSAGLVYTLNGQAYTVTGYDSALPENVVIPSTYRNVAVTAIAERAFANSALKTVTIPESVTNVGDEAFRNCGNLTKVNYLGTMESWIDKTCYFDSFPADYKLYINNTSIDENLVIPSSVAQIKSYSFRGVSNVKTITIPEGVTKLGARSFANCKNLTEIRFNATACDDLEFFVCEVFTNSGKNTNGINVTIGKNVTKIPSLLFFSEARNGNVAAKITNVSFENGSVCESIGHNAFNGLKTLETINIPSSITSIKNDAFSNCGDISVTIEDLTAWFNITFDSGKANPLHCAKELIAETAGSIFGKRPITQITVPSSVTEIKNFAFYGCKVIGALSFEANSQCTVIGIGAFSDCRSLRSVSLPASLTSIYTSSANSYENAFYNCSVIEIRNESSLQLTKGGTTFGQIAKNALNIYSSTSGNGKFDLIAEQDFSFYYDDENGYILVSLVPYYDKTKTDVVLPSYINNADGNPGTYKIFKNAFLGNSFITSVTIPDTVTSIGENAFEGCVNLKKVYYTGDIEAWCNLPFENEYANPLCNGAELYINNQPATQIQIPSSVTAINPYAFYGCTNITNITLHDGITSIGLRAFDNCSGLLFNVYDNANYLGSASNPYIVLISSTSKSIKTCAIHEDTRFIYNNAFDKCTRLQSITIPQRVVSIGCEAFKDCESLTELNFNATACEDFAEENRIFTYAGQDGDGIYVTIGANVTKLPAYMFFPGPTQYYSPKIATIEFKGTKEQWSDVIKGTEWKKGVTAASNIICSDGRA